MFAVGILFPLVSVISCPHSEGARTLVSETNGNEMPGRAHEGWPATPRVCRFLRCAIRTGHPCSDFQKASSPSAPPQTWVLYSAPCLQSRAKPPPGRGLSGPVPPGPLLPSSTRPAGEVDCLSPTSFPRFGALALAALGLGCPCHPYVSLVDFPVEIPRLIDPWNTHHISI